MLQSGPTREEGRFVAIGERERKVQSDENGPFARLLAAADLHGKLPISNFAEFEAACTSDSRLADKVIAVRVRPYFEDLAYAMVKPVIDEFKLDVPTTTGSNGQVELVFRTGPADRFRILRLVDDDYLRSTMTKHLYEVNSKVDQS